MTKSPRYHSFSLLDILTILLSGSAFILAGFCVEWIAQAVPGSRVSAEAASRYLSIYAQVEWQAGSALQMQMVAHEALGLATYSGANNVIQSLDQEKPCAY
jgi:hypothetical protein